MMQIGYELHPQFEQAWASAQNENLRLNQGKEGLCHRLTASLRAEGASIYGVRTEGGGVSPKEDVVRE